MSKELNTSINLSLQMKRLLLNSKLFRELMKAWREFDPKRKEAYEELNEPERVPKLTNPQELRSSEPK